MDLYGLGERVSHSGVRIDRGDLAVFDERGDHRSVVAVYYLSRTIRGASLSSDRSSSSSIAWDGIHTPSVKPPQTVTDSLGAPQGLFAR